MSVIKHLKETTTTLFNSSMQRLKQCEHRGRAVRQRHFHPTHRRKKLQARISESFERYTLPLVSKLYNITPGHPLAQNNDTRKL